VEIAESYGGKAVSFEEFPRHLGEADIVISSTAAPHFILTREKTAASLKIRKGRPLFIVDIAVPRDVEPSVGNLDNVYLYNIDDLKETVSQNLDQRACEIAKVEEIIEEEARSYLDYLSERGAVPLIREMRESFESIGREELQRALSRNNLTQREQKLLETFSGSLMQKLLHRPTVKLKELASGGADQRTLDVVRDLFCSLEKDGEVRND
jgi:glutamyl-tRNA reductase